MSVREINVPVTARGQRLDRFLTAVLELSRNQTQRLIHDKLVTVNGAIPTPHHWLKGGELIVVASRPALTAAAVPPLIIVDETDDYIVVVKPAGVLAHPASGSRAPTLTEALLKHMPALASVGQPGRPGIVHRLDRDVAGLMVVAKTQAMYDYLQRQFHNRLVKKIYTALVEGVVAKPEGTLNFPLARSRTKSGLMAARPAGAIGRSAETKFTLVRRYVDHTLLELELVTGRTHQIRAHCKAFGHPIVGDHLYGSRTKHDSKAKGRAAPQTRPFLMATRLGFNDQLGTWREYTAPLDPILTAYLTNLP